MEEGSFSRSCEWITDLPRATAVAYAPQLDIRCGDAYGQTYNQFCMDTVSAFRVSSIQETPTTENYSRGHYCSPTEEIGLLNIPSIYETMGSSFENVSTRQPLASDWKCSGKNSKCSSDTVCSRSDEEPNISERFDEGEDEDDEVEDEDENMSQHVPREPLKRLRRQRANDRERRRMKSLNGALNNLKRCIPLPKTKRRVTKLEILRIACHYIQTLWETLNSGNEEHTDSKFGRSGQQAHIVNGMTVTQRLSLLSNNLKFNFQL